ncbi:hypothetical protein SDC9_23320 [bioreactor metagenome]|uniref:Glycosyl transferase family 1 domain-containing protein n=1 Tax=bioreactor metagenome TaxID=1076179 RepID=A0A644UEY1_9ZZZZ
MEKKKRILLVTQYFYPENFKSNDIAFELQKRGYQVDALVGIPNYPEGEYYKGYGIFKKRIETINGVRVYRAFQTPRGRKATGLGLSINYLTYAFFASIWALFFAILKKRYDAIIVHQTSPITQAYPALLISKIRKIPIYMWVLDIWPDAMTSGGGIKNKRILSFMNNRVKGIYNSCHKILISSKRMSDSILSKGDFKDKIIYFPNWAEKIFENPTYKEIPELPTGYRIMIAGNLGKSQNFETIMKAISLLKETEIKWILIGDGSQKKWIEEYIEENNLKNCVFLLGKFPIEFIPSFYSKTDALLFSLKNTFPHLKMVVPSRLQTYMSSGKPILAMIDGGAAELIQESDCGLSVNAADYEGFARLIKYYVLKNKEEFAQKGENGKKYFDKYFRLDVCINNLISIIEDERK